MKRGTDPDLVEDDASPALATAAKYGLVDLVQAILDHGGGINALDNYGHTAATNAVVGNHADVLTLLLEHGVDVNAAYPEDGQIQLLHIAAAHDALECAQILLDHGAVIDAKSELNSSTALMFALDEIQGPRIACLLIERGADTQGALERAEHYKDSEEDAKNAAKIIEMLKARIG